MLYIINIKKWLLAVLAFLLSLGYLLGQPMEWMPEIRNSKSWDFPKADERLSVDQYLLNLKKNYSSKIEFKKIRQRDQGNTSHIFYQQYFDGLRVEGAELNLHIRDGNFSSRNGKVIGNLGQISFPPNSNLDHFRKLAVKEAGASIVGNEDIEAERIFTKDHNGDYLIADRFFVNLAQSSAKQLVDIDANTGKMIRSLIYAISCDQNHVEHESPGHVEQSNESGDQCASQSLASQACLLASGTTRHYGYRYANLPYMIHTPENQSYTLRDECRNITTLDFRNGVDGNISPNNNWLTTEEMDPYSAHWAIKIAHDFYNFKLGRNGHFGGGDVVKAHVYSNNPIPTSNAAWANPYNLFSVNFDDPSWISLEATGHEYTHGVIWAAKWDYNLVPLNLITFTETRSITEAFGNFLGNEVEFYAHQFPYANANGNISNDFKFDGNENQYSEFDFQWTGSTLSSSFYKGNNWGTNNWSSDNIYYRAHVISHLFYLLADPSVKTNYVNNDKPNPVNLTIQPLNGANSRHEATLLFYLTIMDYITSEWTFKDFAFGLLEKSRDIYGLCSQQTENVFKALYAVGLADGPSVIDICGLSDPLKNRDYYSPQFIVLGSDCNQTFYTGPPSSPITITFHTGKLVIEGDCTFEGFGSVEVEDGLCNSGSGFPQLSFANTYHQVTSANRALDETDDAPFGLFIFPNPFEDQINLELDLGQNKQSLSLEIFNTSGKQLKQKRYGQLDGKFSEKIDMSLYPSGIYIVKILHGNKVLTQKISRL